MEARTYYLGRLRYQNGLLSLQGTATKTADWRNICRWWLWS